MEIIYVIMFDILNDLININRSIIYYIEELLNYCRQPSNDT